MTQRGLVLPSDWRQFRGSFIAHPTSSGRPPQALIEVSVICPPKHPLSTSSSDRFNVDCDLGALLAILEPRQ